jgi:hypothetical protein
LDEAPERLMVAGAHNIDTTPKHEREKHLDAVFASFRLTINLRGKHQTPSALFSEF